MSYMFRFFFFLHRQVYSSAKYSKIMMLEVSSICFGSCQLCWTKRKLSVEERGEFPFVDVVHYSLEIKKKGLLGNKLQTYTACEASANSCKSVPWAEKSTGPNSGINKMSCHFRFFFKFFMDIQSSPSLSMIFSESWKLSKIKRFFLQFVCLLF